MIQSAHPSVHVTTIALDVQSDYGVIPWEIDRLFQKFTFKCLEV
jgi:hypothetical protein